MLKHYPVDLLKIDRSFVDGLGRNAQDTAIVHAVIAFARTPGSVRQFLTAHERAPADLHPILQDR